MNAKSHHLWYLVEAPFAAANAVRLLQTWEDPARRAAAVQGTAFLSQRKLAPALLGRRARIEAMWRRYAGAQGPCPPVVEVQHCIPLWCAPLGTGMVAPLDATDAEDWEVTDAFGAFGLGEDRGATPLTAFLGLVDRLAEVWHEETGQVLPLRWRRALSIRLLCPIHVDAIGGRSWEVPLILAVLRAACRTRDTRHEPARLPWSDRPVFATGTLEPDDSFGPVGAVEPKLAAFVREYGEGLTAILTAHQVEELKGSAVLEAVRVEEADDLAALLRLPPLADGLQRLCGAPHRTEIDGMLELMDGLARHVRFDDADAVTRWLLPHVSEPLYRARLLRYAGASHLHAGRMVAAAGPLIEAGEQHRRHPECFGAGDRAFHAALIASHSIDAGDPRKSIAALESCIEDLAVTPPPDRVRVLGSLCQVMRACHRHDDAVRWGERAVQEADRSLASEGGRSRNYLVHALLARARSEGAESDLSRAERLLGESVGPWAPVASVGARRSHMGFCLHYEAELARLRDAPFEPPPEPPWTGRWGHAWLFVLLACARNRSHAHASRRSFATQLVEACPIEGCEPTSLFVLLGTVYRALHASIEGRSERAIDSVLVGVDTWCRELEKLGYPGWRERLSPLLAPDSVDALCDAIPYH